MPGERNRYGSRGEQREDGENVVNSGNFGVVAERTARPAGWGALLDVPRVWFRWFYGGQMGMEDTRNNPTEYLRFVESGGRKRDGFILPRGSWRERGGNEKRQRMGSWELGGGGGRTASADGNLVKRG